MNPDLIPFIAVGLAVGGFFLGSVMFSRWIPLWLRGVDVCEQHPDRNPGAGNVFMSCGWRLGMICLIFDLAKGFVPVYAAVRLGLAGTPVFAVIAAAPVLGHAIAPLNGFRGGKCISAIFGTLLGMVKYTPLVFLLAVIYILFSTVIKINPNRRRSIVTFTLFGLIGTAAEVYGGRVFTALYCSAVSFTAILRHRRQPGENDTDADGAQESAAVTDRRKHI